MASIPTVAGRSTNAVDYSSAYPWSVQSGLGAAFLGENRNRPNQEQDIVLPAHCVYGASDHCPADAVAGRGGSRETMRPELLWRYWAMFVSGHLICAAVMFSVIVLLTGACFDEKLALDDNDVNGSLRGEESSQKIESRTKFHVFTSLILSLGLELFYAVLMSLTFRLPLNITSVHIFHLGPDWSGTDRSSMFVPASNMWFVVYMFGGAASESLSLNSSCERTGGSGLGLYMTISGIVMKMVGYTVLAVIWTVMFITVSSLIGRANSWCAATRRIISQHILSKGRFLDVFWRLQGIVWLYRVGRSGLTVCVTLGTLSVVGVVLRAIGISGTDCPSLRFGGSQRSLVTEHSQTVVQLA